MPNGSELDELSSMNAATEETRLGAPSPSRRRLLWGASLLALLVVAVGLGLGLSRGSGGGDSAAVDMSAGGSNSADIDTGSSPDNSPVVVNSTTETPPPSTSSASSPPPEDLSPLPAAAPVPTADAPPPAPQLAFTSPVPAPAQAPAPAVETPAPQGAWSQLPEISIAMGEVAAGVLSFGTSDYIVVVGEHPGGSSGEVEGTTMIYDIAGETWFAGSKRPYPGDHHAAEVHNNTLYLFGGLSGAEEYIQLGKLVQGAGGAPDIEWTAPFPMDSPSGSGCSAKIGNSVYYCGGIDGSTTVTMCGIFDLSSGEWASMPDMLVGRNHAATCTDGEKMYVFGGRSGGNSVGEGFADTQIFTPGQGWTSGTDLPFARGGMGKAIYNDGRCYVFGGEVSKDVAVADGVNELRTLFRVDVYQTATDSWSRAADMPEGLHGIFPVLHEGHVYLAGGGVKAANSQSQANYLFDP